MKYLFAGGGTGGHIFPAIAIADEITKIDTGAEILFVGAKGRIEERIVPSNNYKLETIDIVGINRSNMLKNFGLPLKIISALRRCKEIIGDFKPDVAVGTGGFVCGPVIYQANKMHVPTLIQEGNAYAGKTIKFLSANSDKVVINFDETLKYLKRKDNVIKIAHPIRSSLKRIDKKEALEYFQLPTGKKTILVFGGSQGAKGINEAVSSAVSNIYSSGMNLIWQAGKNDLTKAQREYSEMSDRIRIFEFIDRMDMAYSASDLVVCRAGITSIMELSFMRAPSILIPLPGSAENHQEMNARSFESKGASRVVLQHEAKEKLYGEIVKILNDEETIRAMERSAGDFADPHAAERIALEVKLLAEK
jgi:UDP-N-acetylglucosamine--N-acetylmuramyl-(pentapeptide) pyrophosphoryl-undecaprenol N-acetylglucosamine transferase